MNLCIFWIQTVLITVLVVQYHYTNAVDVVTQNVGNSNWYNSVEKQFEAVQNIADLQETKPELKETAPKRRKRVVKKHRKRVNKPDHLHVPREQRIDVSDHQDKVDVPKKVVRRTHKKRVKGRSNKRKFVKTLPTIESNSSESDEVKRRKPVDIIVHIKMND